jgi:iron complex outermembrane receptor protein
MQKYQFFIGTSLVAMQTALFCAGGARADESAGTGSSAEDSLEEIVVTARRHSEDLQKVPEVIAAFSEAELTQNSITSSYDLSRTVPGLTVSSGSGNPGEANFSIRGRGLNFGASSGSVETYFADVPLSAPFETPTLPPQFFDMQSIQVLKGPQGTLFGRSTTGGAVLMVPQAPTDEFGGYVRLQGGDYGDFQSEGALNIPLVSDKLDFRVAAFDWERDGYSHTYAGTPNVLNPADILPSQSFNNEDVQEFRATLLARPMEGLQNSTILTYHQDNNRNSAGAGLEFTGSSVVPSPGYDTQSSGSDVLIGRGENRTWLVVNTTTYDLAADLALKNIFGFIHSTGQVDMGTNGDGVAQNIISLPAAPRPMKNDQTTEELQLQGKNLGDRLTWTAGALVDLTQEPMRLDDLNIHTVQVSAPDSTASFSSTNVHSYAGYGSLTYNLTDQLALTGGYRHTWDQVSQDNAGGLAAIPSEPVVAIGSTLQQLHKDFEGNDYSINLGDNISDHSLIYVSYKRGYKPGGLNGLVGGLPANEVAFAPETVDDFSIGSKTQFVIAGIEGRFNIEGYYDLYHNNQINFLTYDGGVKSITANVNATTYRGIDADLETDVTAWLLLSASYSYIDAFNTKWVDASCAVQICASPNESRSLASNPVPFAPKNKVRITGRFHMNLPDNAGEVAFAPSLTYQASFVTVPTVVISPQAAVGLGLDGLAYGADTVPAYALVDLRMEWKNIMGSQFSAAFNAINLTNKLYFLGNTGTINFGAQGDAYGPPRMVTGEVSVKF